MYYFINAFFEIDHSDNLENEKALRKCGNYFKTSEKALEALRAIKNCMQTTPENVEKLLENVGFKATRLGKETTYTIDGGEDRDLYIVITHESGAVNYSIEVRNHIFHYEGMFNYIHELNQILEVCAIKISL